MVSKNFYKQKRSDKIWWVYNPEEIGIWEFSFDKETIFNMFADYPHKLTSEQKSIFDKENPYWANFFKDRGEDHDKRSTVMVRLTDFASDDKTLSCKLYPEDSPSPGTLIIEKASGEIIDFTLPKDYEWCANHVAHAARELRLLGELGSFPPERRVYWY